MYIENNFHPNKKFRKMLGMQDKIINSINNYKNNNPCFSQRNLSSCHKNRHIINNFNKNNIQMIPKTQRRKLTVINDYFSNSLKKSNEWIGKLTLTKENNINYQSPPKSTINSYKNVTTTSSNINNYNNYHIDKPASNLFQIKDFYKSVKNKGPLLSNRDAYNELNEKIKKILEDENLKIEPTKKKKYFKTESLMSKRIKILKNVKNIVNRYRKNPKTASSSFLSLFAKNDENSPEAKNDKEKYLTRNGFERNGLSYEKKYFLTSTDKFYNNRPVLIKYMPKPKLKLAKYSTLNQIKII